jgi:ubiquinone/menaquinone biosynthesis C-methylase UbiE
MKRSGGFRIFLALVLAWAFARSSLMSLVYDFLVVHMSAEWYREVLSRHPNNSIILDIGIGTGTALHRNAALLKSKNMRVVGVDYEEAYIKSAEELWSNHIDVVNLVTCSIYDVDDLKANIFDTQILAADVKAQRATFDEEPVLDETSGNPKDSSRGDAKLFDSVYFSGSFTLLPDPLEALRIAKMFLIQDTGRIYITQTYLIEKAPMTEIVKPWLRWITTVDFGRAVYVDEIETILKKANMKIVTNEIMQNFFVLPNQNPTLIILDPWDS